MERKESMKDHLVKAQLSAAIVVGVLFAVGKICHGEVNSTTIAQVYECRVNGRHIFSDQPCAVDAAKREINATNTMSAREAEIGYKASPLEHGKRKSVADDTDPRDKQRQRCIKLSNDKQNVTSRLRSGYSNNQGERLRERLRKIEAEYFELKCSSGR